MRFSLRFCCSWMIGGNEVENEPKRNRMRRGKVLSLLSSISITYARGTPKPTQIYAKMPTSHTQKQLNSHIIIIITHKKKKKPTTTNSHISPLTLSNKHNKKNNKKIKQECFCFFWSKSSFIFQYSFIQYFHFSISSIFYVIFLFERIIIIFIYIYR